MRRLPGRRADLDGKEENQRGQKKEAGNNDDEAAGLSSHVTPLSPTRRRPQVLTIRARRAPMPMIIANDPRWVRETSEQLRGMHRGHHESYIEFGRGHTGVVQGLKPDRNALRSRGRNELPLFRRSCGLHQCVSTSHRGLGAVNWADHSTQSVRLAPYWPHGSAVASDWACRAQADGFTVRETGCLTVSPSSRDASVQR
jgi:hypothetical protein